MKLRNKKTGENYEATMPIVFNIKTNGGGEHTVSCGSIAELNEKWEDYEEPKDSALDLMILTLTDFIENEPDEDKVDLDDCKQMLEKLKAWKRLKDKGFKITLVQDGGYVYLQADWGLLLGDFSDVELLFGDEE